LHLQTHISFNFRLKRGEANGNEFRSNLQSAVDVTLNLSTGQLIKKVSGQEEKEAYDLLKLSPGDVLDLNVKRVVSDDGWEVCFWRNLLLYLLLPFLHPGEIWDSWRSLAPTRNP
jgi:hypothetical protein